MHLFKIQLIPNLLQKSKILQEMHLKSVYYSKYIANVDIGLLKKVMGSLHMERLWGKSS